MQKQWVFPVLVLLQYPGKMHAQKKIDQDSVSPVTKDSIPLIQTGVASFYDDKFEGRQTSNGDIFSQKNLTAASNTLPLNSWAKVTNISNNRSVIVHITDRMNPKNKRLIDLSRSAASKLGYVGKGLTQVKVEWLGRKKPVPASTPKSGQ